MHTHAKVHPTAIVGSAVRLGENVEVGPYAIVEDGVRIGNDCVIQAHAILTNNVTIGDRNLVGYGSVIGSPPQDLAHNDSISSQVIIGNDNVLREYVTIHRGSKEGSATKVGNGNLLMSGVHLGHNASIGDRNVFANNCLLAGYADAGDDIVLGGGSVFHQFLRIGSMCMIRGGTAWSKDIPPFTVGVILNKVCGINSIGMRRKSIDAHGREDVKKAYKLLYRSGLNVTQAVDAGRNVEWTKEGRVFMDFVAQRTKRGLCASQAESAAVSE